MNVGSTWIKKCQKNPSHPPLWVVCMDSEKSESACPASLNIKFNQSTPPIHNPNLITPQTLKPFYPLSIFSLPNTHGAATPSGEGCYPPSHHRRVVPLPLNLTAALCYAELPSTNPYPLASHHYRILPLHMALTPTSTRKLDVSISCENWCFWSWFWVVKWGLCGWRGTVKMVMCNWSTRLLIWGMRAWCWMPTSERWKIWQRRYDGDVGCGIW